MAVRSGTPHPAIDSGDAVKAAVLAARTLGYSTGPSGSYLLSLFERWGIAQQLAPRIVQAPPGVPVAALVARGEVELGFQQLSELMHVPGIDVLGPLPDDVQSMTVFCGAVSTASEQPAQAAALLRFLASPDAVATKQAHGMEPA
jgi:molybdate transport system substrate-binding protein